MTRLRLTTLTMSTVRMVACLLGCLLTAGGLLGQSRNVELVGVVSDSAGGAAAGALVVITNEATGVKVETVTNEVGLYRVANLLPGSYQVTVTLSGFKTFRREGFPLQVAQIGRLDVALELGQLAEQVTVRGEAPILQTESAEALSQTIATREMRTLPSFNRKYTDMVALSALTRTLSQQGHTHDTIAFAGNRNDFGTGFFLNGAQAQDQGFTMPVNGFSSEFVEEFRLVANNFSAELTGVQVVSVVTKSGTNGYHGGANFFFQSDKLNATPWGSPTKPVYDLNEFGASIGGPIRKDKTHFFVGFQREHRDENNPAILTIPTRAQIRGDYSQTFDSRGGLIRIYDPATTRADRTRDPFPGNIIPTSRIDPVGANILSYYPEPNLPGTIAGANNYLGPYQKIQTTPQINGRLDHQWTEKHKTFASLIWHHYSEINPSVYRSQYVFDNWSGRYRFPCWVWLGNAGHTWVPNARWVIDTSVAHNAMYLVQADAEENWNAGIPTKLGLKGVPSSYPFPVINIAGLNRFGGTSSARHAFDPQAQGSYNQRFSNYRGRHALKFGLETERIWKTHDPQDNISSLDFGPQLTALPGTAGTGSPVASLLLGLPNSGGQNPLPMRIRNMWWYGLYLDDSWKVRSNLTLNLGLRWETITPAIFKDETGQLSLTSFNTTAINPVSGTPGIITYAGKDAYEGVWRQYWKRFQPRVGFAWQPGGANSKTVVRGGGGIFYASIGTGGGPHYGAAVGLARQGAWTASEVGINFPFRLQDGYPAIITEPPGPGFGAVRVGESPRLNIDFVNPDTVIPSYTIQYNLGIERRLPGEMTVEALYLGNLGRHLAIRAQDNQVRAALFGPGNGQGRRPFPQYGDIWEQMTSGGTSSFHALELKLEKRLSHGLNFQSDYVFNKYLTDVSHWDLYDRRGGNRQEDRQHRWVGYVIYDLPFGAGKNWANRGAASRILGGWTTTSFVRWQSANYLDVTYVSNTTNGFPMGNQGVNLVGQPNLAKGERTFARYFNTDAFAAPAAYKFGNSGRTLVQGPGAVDFNAAFQKHIPIRERVSAAFKAEFFNLFNHSNWQSPGTTLGSPNFGIVARKSGNRQIQLGGRLIF